MMTVAIVESFNVLHRPVHVRACRSLDAVDSNLRPQHAALSAVQASHTLTQRRSLRPVLPAHRPDPSTTVTRHPQRYQAARQSLQ